MCLGALIASAWFTRPAAGVDCNRLAPLTVLATLGAFLMAMCFRQMARYTERSSRWFLVVCLVMAAVVLFADFRYVRRYRGVCSAAEQMQIPASPKK